MKLRTKTLLALVGTFICFFILILGISVTITSSGLHNLETEDGDESTLQALAALQNEGDSLLKISQDWSRWDDMYQYVNDQNTDFVVKNLDPGTLANVNLNLMIISDSSGKVIFVKELSRDFSTEQDIPEPVLARIRSLPEFSNITDRTTGTLGIIMLPEGAMEIAVSPILPSDTQGPSRGTVIMGRYLDTGILSHIRIITGFPVEIFSKYDPAITPEILQGLAKPDSRGIFVQPVDENTLAGYAVFTAMDGEPLYVRTTMPRTLYHTGFSIVSQFFVLFIISAITITIIVMLVMDYVVLRRIALLSHEVDSYTRRDGEKLPEPVLSGADELAQLETTIRKSHTNLAESEQRFRRIIETAQEGFWLTDEKSGIVLVNTQIAKILGYTDQEMMGLPIHKFVPDDELLLCDRHRKTWAEGIQERFECRLKKKDGSVIWAIISVTPIMNQDTFSGSFAMITDITERKQVEDSLLRATKKLNLLNAITFNDIQNSIFALSGYLHLTKSQMPDGHPVDAIEKEIEIVSSISESLEYAKNYQSLGLSPPIWQDVSQAFLFGISHLDVSKLKRNLAIDKVEIFADPLLEHVFLVLAENTIIHAPSATEISMQKKETEAGLFLIYEDNGPGIPVERKERIFERHYSKKTAMGLFLAREILGITGITIRETGEPVKGVRFEILVPKNAYRISRK